MFGCVSIPQISSKVLRPKFFLDLIIFRPCVTIALFKPIYGTTSHTVPSVTKSKNSNKLGSEIFL